MRVRRKQYNIEKVLKEKKLALRVRISNLNILTHTFKQLLLPLTKKSSPSPTAKRSQGYVNLPLIYYLFYHHSLSYPIFPKDWWSCKHFPAVHDNNKDQFMLCPVIRFCYGSGYYIALILKCFWVLIKPLITTWLC